MTNRAEENINPGLDIEVWSPKLTPKQIEIIKSPHSLAISVGQDVAKDIARMSELDSQEFGHRYGMDYSEALRYLVYNLRSAACVLRDKMTGIIEGFTIAIPARDAYFQNGTYSNRESEEDVAYIVTTVISPEHRGKGNVGILMRQLEKELKNKGFNFIDRDAKDLRHEGGESYADKIVRQSGDKIVINQKIPDTPLGPQRYIRIKI